jgi:hypothetical protein
MGEEGPEVAVVMMVGLDLKVNNARRGSRLGLRSHHPPRFIDVGHI